jgi:hypothetical protein
MLSLPTKGGPITLPETASSILVVLDCITYVDVESVPDFDTVVAALELAKRFDMKGPKAKIKELLHDGHHKGPRLLAFACQQNPIDRVLVRFALSLFADRMTMDDKIYRSNINNEFYRGTILDADSALASPNSNNLKIGYLESLTTVGCIAFLKALDECEIARNGQRRWNWPKIPEMFMKHLDHYER